MPVTTNGTASGTTSVSVLGHRVERREDPPLLDGSARFVADIRLPGMLHAVFVRAAVAHGELRGVDVSSALACDGVVAAFGATDLDLPDISQWPRAGASPRPVLARPCLARDRVRFVGEAVAVVVAESAAAAADAAEQVIVDVEPLEVVVTPEQALSRSQGALDGDAPGGGGLLFPELGTNVVLEASAGEVGTSGDEEEDDGVLAGAEVVVRARFVNQRVAPVPMEPNGIVVIPLADGRLDCLVSCQAPFQVRAGIARALGCAEDDVRVRTPAVGGGFGAKGGIYPEHLVVAAIARRLGRPVCHVESRGENLVSMSHGRGQLQDVALGARRDGTIVGLRARTVTDVGAYCWRGTIPFHTARLMATGVYRIPRLSWRSVGVVTNTTPIGPYRGAGRPEAAAMLERAVDMLAATLGMDPAELRRRNFLPPTAFPYTTQTGAVYDSGDYAKALARLLELAGYDALREEQAERRARRAAGVGPIGTSTVDGTSAVDDRLMGIGLATFVEISGGGSEYGAVHVDPDGTIVVTTGASPHGQGHETTLAQVVSDALGVPMEAVRVVHSDTDAVARGVGTFGSRSGQLAGNAAARAAASVLDQARAAAASLLEADPADIVLTDGGLSVAGVPARALSWAEVLAGAPGGILAAEDDFAQEEGTYPFGAHLAVVDVDPETGAVELRRLVAVDDCGTIVNPMVVEGQVHGGLAQGIAQALFEEVRYDEAGNPLTASLADYGVPSAAELPSFELAETVTPSPRNPLGMKGIGESGTVGSTVAVQNAVVDALAPLGVRHLDMPLGPGRVWAAIHAALGS